MITKGVRPKLKPHTSAQGNARLMCVAFMAACGTDLEQPGDLVGPQPGHVPSTMPAALLAVDTSADGPRAWRAADPAGRPVRSHRIPSRPPADPAGTATSHAMIPAACQRGALQLTDFSHPSLMPRHTGSQFPGPCKLLRSRLNLPNMVGPRTASRRRLIHQFVAWTATILGLVTASRAVIPRSPRISIRQRR